MKKIYIILIVALALALVIAIQNHDSAVLHFFNLQFSGSLALLILITFLLGMIAGILIILPSYITARNQKNKLEQKTKASEKTITTSGSQTQP